MTASRNGTTGNVGYYHSYKYESLDFSERFHKMHGIKKVVIFCLLTIVFPTVLLIVPLYLKHKVFTDVHFAVTESDVVEIKDDISALFCSGHTLKMNDTFNAFQVSKRPEKTSFRKHIRLKKSMILPDDTLEYWGFYLLKGSKVALSVCSRFPGASILVVKGERSLRTCGMLEHNQNKARATGIYLPEAHQQVKVTFESNAQEIHSQEITYTKINVESQPTIVSTDSKPENIKKNLTKDSQRQSRNLVKNNSIVNDTLVNPLLEDKNLSTLVTTAEKYLNKHLNSKQEENNSTNKHRHLKRIRRLHNMDNENDKINSEYIEDDAGHIKSKAHRKKHTKNVEIRKKISGGHKERKIQLKQELRLNAGQDEQEVDNHGKEEEIDEINLRYKRSQRPIKPELLDRGVRHGGNANNATDDDSSSISSFENGLLRCYGGNVLLAHEFAPSDECKDVNYLLNGTKHMQTVHEVSEDGYYYYIFYSDHDKEKNDIHAVFDIYKPTLQYENVTEACINKTECIFSVSISSIDRIIVEVPTKDGIDHDIDDVSLLVSTCEPRMGMYIIFPVAVLLLILGCAFM